jgi:hypothetical protein
MVHVGHSRAKIETCTSTHTHEASGQVRVRSRVKIFTRIRTYWVGYPSVFGL